MIGITEVAFVGYPVTDVARARKFYETVLGLKPSMAHEFQAGVWWIEYEIGSVALALSNAWPPSGQSGPSIALEVADLDAALAKFRGENIPASYGPMDTPVCSFFGVQDPDGNTICIHKRKTG